MWNRKAMEKCWRQGTILQVSRVIKWVLAQNQTWQLRVLCRLVWCGADEEDSLQVQVQMMMMMMMMMECVQVGARKDSVLGTLVFLYSVLFPLAPVSLNFSVSVSLNSDWLLRKLKNAGVGWLFVKAVYMCHSLPLISHNPVCYSWVKGILHFFLEIGSFYNSPKVKQLSFTVFESIQLIFWYLVSGLIDFHNRKKYEEFRCKSL